MNELDARAIDTARILAADAVEKVGSGHPGTAISMAPVGYLLFQDIMRHDPNDTLWFGRDRFVLSCGHASLILYTQLYLGGFGLELQDLKELRTWGSKTPAHPEYMHTDGVEVTTGPLGQGLANAVGMAMAARRERGLFDPEATVGNSPFDHFIYVLASDGDMQEGVTSEASAIAGHQELGNLVVIYDDNRISIEDDTQIAMSEDTLARYESYGWHTQRVDWMSTGEYHEDVAALKEAITAAQQATDRPSIIALRSIIGWPTPEKQDTGAIHGSKLGEDILAGLKTTLNFDPDKMFEVEDDVIAHTRSLSDRMSKERAAWQENFDAWSAANPEAAAEFERMRSGKLRPEWDKNLPTFEAGESVATRKASGKFLSAIADTVPELWGGSADLAGSNNTTMDGADSFIPAAKSTDAFSGHEYGRTLHFGIREHAMGSIMNGIVLHGPTRPYGGTFLTFSDYMRPPVRLAAIMKLPVTYVWTHDSVGLGEDGPTHQPIEQIASLRAIPEFDMVRPADANETVAAWTALLERNERPAGLALTRQGVPVIDRTKYATADNVTKGAYVLAHHNPDSDRQVIVMGSGSEVQLAIEAGEQLASEGIGARVVSFPCHEWFLEQPESYRNEVLPSDVTARVSVEAGLSLTWERFVGPHGQHVSIEDYGASADAETMFTKLGVTTENVVKAAKTALEAANA